MNDPADVRPLAAPTTPQLQLGRPGPDALWLPLAESAPLLLTGADRTAHRTLRWLLGDWVQSLAAAGQVDLLAWSEMEIFLDSAGHPGVSLTPSLGAWLAALRRAATQSLTRPLVFVGYELTGTAGDELLSLGPRFPLSGPGWHLIWAAPPDAAQGRLAADMPWRARLEVEPDSRHISVSRPDHENQRVLADWDRS